MDACPSKFHLDASAQQLPFSTFSLNDCCRLSVPCSRERLRSANGANGVRANGGHLRTLFADFRPLNISKTRFRKKLSILALLVFWQPWLSSAIGCDRTAIGCDRKQLRFLSVRIWGLVLGVVPCPKADGGTGEQTC